ncbi:MAG: CHAT domain-containing tetratricopeptide repeat protein [Bacteroidota bacterium]
MFIKNKLKGALIYLIISAPFSCLSQKGDHLELGNYYFDKAAFHFGTNSDSVLYYINNASKEYLSGQHWEKYILTLNAYCSFYQLKNESRKRQEYALKALNESKKHLDPTNLYYAVSLSNHSTSLRDIGDYTSAIKNFRTVLEIEKHNEKYDLAISSLKNIGDTYKLIGDLEQAIKFYDECFNVESAHPNSMGKQNKIDIYLRRGTTFLDLKDFSKAFENLKLAEALLPKDKFEQANVNKFLAIEINYGFAKIQLARNNFDSLKYYIDKTFEFCKNEYEIEKAQGHVLLGKYYLNNDAPEKAIKQISRAKTQLDTHKRYSQHIRFPAIYNLLGTAYLKNNQDSISILYFKKTIYNLSNRNDEFDSDELVPTSDKLFNAYLSMQAYAGIGKALFNLYQQNNDKKYLQASNLSFEFATNLIFDVRRSYQQNNTLLKFSEEVIPIYEAAIQSALHAYEASGDQEYLDKAFDFNEKSKAILLLESINQSSAIQFADIPDSLIQLEKDLRHQITGLNRKIYEEINALENVNEYKINQLNNQYFQDSENYEALLRHLENAYPQYYKLKHQLRTVSRIDIQQKIKGTRAQIIEFFSGDEFTYIFSIAEDDFKVISIPYKKEYASDIKKIKDFLDTPPSGQNIKHQLKNYAEVTKTVYERYLKDIIHANSKHLIIITDGELGYLPFEALITELPQTDDVSFSLSHLSYLMEKYLVSYSYSSTIFMNSFKTDRSKVQNTFFGVAPSFDLLNSNGPTRVCNENELYSLQCNEDEVRKIKEKLGGEILIGKEATLFNINKEISNSRIIHLATHACLDDKNPEFNKIYLADDYLSNNDLYNLKLNSELAVLSACETGSGRLAKGEGVMSLARGFIHAGCPSIIMSLWSIDDCATSKIMVHFYDELYQGKSKTEALRNAKLRYIQNAKKAYQHPYYWAAFVQIGNYDPMHISSFKSDLVYSTIILIILLLFLWGRKRLKII